MNQRLISVLAFAFIVSAGASLLLYRLLSGRVATQAASPTSRVIVATHTLEPGTLVRDTDLKVSDWTGTVPEGVLRKKEDIVGRGVTSPILGGEPVAEGHLAPKGGGAGLAALIPKGMRAVAVRTNEIVGVAGFVVPGMRVDVLISGSPPGAATLGGVTKTLLQNVEVLSAGQNFQKDAEGKPISVQVVNLLVTPEQAEKLSLASTQTTIQLVLRNPLDKEVAETHGTAVVQLFDSAGLVPQPPKPVPVKHAPPTRPAPASAPLPGAAPAPPPSVVEVINGDKRVETKFSPHGEVKP